MLGYGWVYLVFLCKHLKFFFFFFFFSHGMGRVLSNLVSEIQPLRASWF